jgi:phosphoribosylanthranilate isomerase
MICDDKRKMTREGAGTPEAGTMPEEVGTMVQIKLCGLRHMEDIRIVNRAMPEYAGFILAKGRRRTVSPEQMADLVSGLRPGIRKVGVFLDQDPKWICSLARQGLMDVIQLHGREDDSVIRMLQERTGKMVVKAFRIDSEADAVKAQASVSDMILLDHGDGGSGEAFDWSLIAPVRRAFFLAGGLNPENVRDAVRTAHPAAVDVSSGVETDCRKDEAKVMEFVRQVREMGAGWS